MFEISEKKEILRIQRLKVEIDLLENDSNLKWEK